MNYIQEAQCVYLDAQRKQDQIRVLIQTQSVIRSTKHLDVTGFRTVRYEFDTTFAEFVKHYTLHEKMEEPDISTIQYLKELTTQLKFSIYEISKLL